MADRGRKAHPVSSPVLDEWWQQHVKNLHKQRLANIKKDGKRIDNAVPISENHKPSSAKKEQVKSEQQGKIDYENNILLQKLIKIRNFDSTKAFKPWLARSTFQYSPGTFYDPTTGAKCVDHFNVTATVSPRSIHSPINRPGSPPNYRQLQKHWHILDENSKLLRTIENMHSVYSVERLEREANENSVHSRRLSNYRGPASARYPPGPPRGGSAERLRPYSAQPAPSAQPNTNRLYTPVQRRTASAGRPPRPTASAPPAGQQHGRGEPDYGWRVEEEAHGRPGTRAGGARPAAGQAGLPPMAPPTGANGRGTSAKHREELAELGVVDEEDDGGYGADEFEQPAASPAAQQQRTSGSGGSRGSSAHRPSSARPGSAAGSHGGAAAAAAAGASGNSGSLSPYLQPVGGSGSRPGSAGGAAAGGGSTGTGSRPSSARFSSVPALAASTGSASTGALASPPPPPPAPVSTGAVTPQAELSLAMPAARTSNAAGDDAAAVPDVPDLSFGLGSPGAGGTSAGLGGFGAAISHEPEPETQPQAQQQEEEAPATQQEEEEEPHQQEEEPAAQEEEEEEEPAEEAGLGASGIPDIGGLDEEEDGEDLGGFALPSDQLEEEH